MKLAAPSMSRGMTLIDVVVGTALTLIVFMALYGVLRLSIRLSNLATDTMAASAIASDRMESIRALPYEALASGEETATTTVDGIPYGVHISIIDIDDPVDNSGAEDADGDADYKRIIVSVFYQPSAGPRTLSLTTYSASTTPFFPKP
jgi:hypothetical protein